MAYNQIFPYTPACNSQKSVIDSETKAEDRNHRLRTTHGQLVKARKALADANRQVERAMGQLMALTEKE